MIKRIFDLSVAATGLFFLMPILIVVSILVRLKLGGPVLFRQVRPGLNGIPFKLFKFRTMRELADSTGNSLDDEKRLTALGRFLRSASLDELPELWNVLIGEMSLVGPRPLLVEYLPLYNQRQRRRHEVRPGITGWAQINGRNAIEWEERLELDVWYVENRSFWLDLKILCLTVGKVVRRDDISFPGQATQTKFRGNSTHSKGQLD